MKDRLVQQQVKEGRVISLNHEEEEFFRRYRKESRANYDTGRVCPDPLVNQVGIPWDGGNNSDCNQEGELVEVNWLEEGSIKECERNGRRYRVFEMTVLNTCECFGWQRGNAM